MKIYYIQSKPPTENFIHHSGFTSLKKIWRSRVLIEGKPYKGVSLTTDIGRFTGYLPGFFGGHVDGFIQMPANKLENLVAPCLYKTHDPTTAAGAKELGHNVYLKEELPAEYKYILHLVTKNVMFVDENEWVHLGQQLWLTEDSKLYILPRFYKRFVNSVSKLPFPPSLEGVHPYECQHQDSQNRSA